VPDESESAEEYPIDDAEEDVLRAFEHALTAASDAKSMEQACALLQMALSAVTRAGLDDDDIASPRWAEPVTRAEALVLQMESKRSAALENLRRAIDEASAVDQEEEDLPKLVYLRRRLSDGLRIASKLHLPCSEIQIADRIRLKTHRSIQNLRSQIRVCCRVRELNEKEKQNGDKALLELLDDFTLMIPGTGCFTFDGVFTPGSQEEVFEDCRDVVQSAIDGRNATIFTYGPTGAGKTTLC
jgi:hypothetical protein